MKNLIIHPKDSTTDFLCDVYARLPNKTVVNWGMPEDQLTEQIRVHDRIMMMGHGTPSGLVIKGSPAYFLGYIVDDTTVEFLEEKKNSVFIWCNADQFVIWHGLTGFFTGMFVSETREAEVCGLASVTQEMIDESNHTFANTVAKYLEESSERLHRKVVAEYGLLARYNPVAAYNHERLYFIA